MEYTFCEMLFNLSVNFRSVLRYGCTIRPPPFDVNNFIYLFALISSYCSKGLVLLGFFLQLTLRFVVANPQNMKRHPFGCLFLPINLGS